MGRGLDGLISRYEESCAVLRDRSVSQNSGGYCVGETPLPIPNRAVKPHSADGTWLARAWESRSPPVSSSRAARGRLVVVLGTPVRGGAGPPGRARGGVEGEGPRHRRAPRL